MPPVAPRCPPFAAPKAEEPSLKPLILDVTDPVACDAAAARVAAEMTAAGDKFVGLVNNAGVSRRLPLELEVPSLFRRLAFRFP